MVAQRFRIAKIAGKSGELLADRLRKLSNARRKASPTKSQPSTGRSVGVVSDAGSWSTQEWPARVRRAADRLAEQIILHSHELPVIHYVEWVDSFSAGLAYVYRYLEFRDPLFVFADRFDIAGYVLPDGGKLRRRLARRKRSRIEEAEWFALRLQEAIDSWKGLADSALLVILREPVGATVENEEVTAALTALPKWVTGIR